MTFAEWVERIKRSFSDNAFFTSARIGDALHDALERAYTDIPLYRSSEEITTVAQQQQYAFTNSVIVVNEGDVQYEDNLPMGKITYKKMISLMTEPHTITADLGVPQLFALRLVKSVLKINFLPVPEESGKTIYVEETIQRAEYADGDTVDLQNWARKDIENLAKSYLMEDDNRFEVAAYLERKYLSRVPELRLLATKYTGPEYIK